MEFQVVKWTAALYITVKQQHVLLYYSLIASMLVQFFIFWQFSCVVVSFGSVD